MPGLLYARQATRHDLVSVAHRLQDLDPALAVQLLAADPNSKWQDDRFLRSTWGTLVTRLAPLVTEAAVRTFGGSDFRPSELYTSSQPVTVYLRWPERNLEALVPLVRLVWDSLLGELIEWWGAASPAQRTKATPVLCLVDEAARTPIPALAEYMGTAAGYGISIWVAVQSLAQLDTNYGPARATTIRDGADAQVYYRQRDVETAEALSRRTGPMLVHGRNNSHSQGSASTPTASWSEGYSEREQPLLMPHEILQLDAEHVVAFAGGTPPARLERIDWRKDDQLRELVSQPAPAVPVIPETLLADWQPSAQRIPSRATGRAQPRRLMTTHWRNTLTVLVVALAVIGSLRLLSWAQTATQHVSQEQHIQQLVAMMTATVRAAEPTMVSVRATQHALAEDDRMRIEAEATRSTATLTTYWANLSAAATSTATAKR